jgi:hypothetical protein
MLTYVIEQKPTVGFTDTLLSTKLSNTRSEVKVNSLQQWQHIHTYSSEAICLAPYPDLTKTIVVKVIGPGLHEMFFTIEKVDIIWSRFKRRDHFCFVPTVGFGVADTVNDLKAAFDIDHAFGGPNIGTLSRPL